MPADYVSRIQNVSQGGETVGVHGISTTRECSKVMKSNDKELNMEEGGCYATGRNEFEELHKTVDRPDVKEEKNSDDSEIGLRRFSIMSVSSTNLASLDRTSMLYSDFENGAQNIVSESISGFSSDSFAKLNSDSKVNVSCGPNSTDNLFNDTLISFDTCKKGSALLKVETKFVRSADAFVSIVDDEKECELSSEANPDRDLTSQPVISKAPTDQLSVLHTQSVCRIDIESCSTTDESLSDIDGKGDDNNDNSLPERRLSLSLLGVPKRFVCFLATDHFENLRS